MCMTRIHIQSSIVMRDYPICIDRAESAQSFHRARGDLMQHITCLVYIPATSAARPPLKMYRKILRYRLLHNTPLDISYAPSYRLHQCRNGHPLRTWDLSPPRRNGSHSYNLLHIDEMLTPRIPRTMLVHTHHAPRQCINKPDDALQHGPHASRLHPIKPGEGAK